ncbi:MAG: ABC transporter permease subunit [Acidimicrobiales bacterium]
MLTSIFSKGLWDSRRSLLGWTVAIVAVGCGYSAFWPTIDRPEIQEALDSYPQGLLDALNYDDISTAAGYLTASVYGLVVAILLVVYAVSAGARAVAGDEEAGRLDLIAAHPVSRTRLGLQRCAAVLVSVILVSFIFWLAMLALASPANFDDISVAQFAAMHLHLALFGGFFGALTYAVGAATGARSLALGTGSAVAVLGYLANGIIPTVDGLEWVENLSPFGWLTGSDPLRNGVDVADCALMGGLAMLLVAIGTWVFNRRDIAV